MNKMNDEEKRYKRFRQMLLMKEEIHSCFVCGSCSELPIGCVLSNPTDVDKMYWAKHTTAYETNDTNRDPQFPKATFTIDTSNCHVGFARLKKLRLSSEDRNCSYYRKPSTPHILTAKGPSWPKVVATDSKLSVARSLLGNFNQVFHDIESLKLDLVYAVYCPSWPLVAAEWRTRKRRNGCPSKDVIDQIVGLGCHLVAKPYQRDPDDDTQWRFSFSQAEVILIRSWTDVQKYIYHLLRLIKTEVVELCGGEEKTVLCTYFFKTLMLWACEEKPPEFWKDENLKTSVSELLCTMIEWLIERCCPNYFIPSNNMIDHVSDDIDLSNEISSLLQYKDNNLSELLTNVSREYLDSPLNFAVPNKLIDFTLLTLNNSYFNQAFRINIEALHCLLSDSDNFVPELRCLFDAIQIQLHLTNARGKFGRCEILSITRHFDSAMTANNNSLSVATVFLRSTLSDILDDLLLFVENHYGQKSLKPNSAPSRRKCEIKSNNLTEYKDCSCMTDTSECSTCHHSPNLQTKEECSCRCFLENNDDCLEKAEGNVIVEESVLGCGVSNLLKNLAYNWASPAYLISAAYCANFYYTVLQDYRSATEQFKMAVKYLEGLKNSASYLVSENIFTRAFAVLLTNDWSALFDSDLQILLGFITLSRAISAKSQALRRKSIVIHICPYEFLKYIHFQSTRKLGEREPVNYECNFRDAAVSLFNGQRDYESVSRILFVTAIRISGLVPQQLDPETYSVQWP